MNIMPTLSYKKTVLSAISLGLLTAGLVLPSNPLLAQEAITLTATPPRIGDAPALVVKPGEKTQVTLRVRNASSQTQSIRTLAKDFVIDQDGSTPIPVDVSVNSRWSLASWMVIAPSEQTLAPGQTGALQVLIEVPADAHPGGKYAMVTHTPGNALIENQSGSGTTNEVGTLVYLVVDGPINQEAIIRQFKTVDFSEMGPVPFSFEIENLSDIHIKPQMSVAITDMFGRTVETIQVESNNIFPLSKRVFSAQWNQVWGYGRYTATVTVSYGSGLLTSAKVHFWLFPITLVIAVVVGLFIIFFFIWAIGRHLKHRKQEQEKKIAELEQKVHELETKNE